VSSSPAPLADLPCDPGRASHRPSTRMVVAIVVGVLLLALGAALRPQDFPIVPLLITAGALVLLLGVALPWVTQIHLGAPLLAQVTIAMDARSQAIRQKLDDLQGMLKCGAFLLCPDKDSAERLLEACASATMVNWHGSTDEGLKRYVACLLVDEARIEAALHPGPVASTEPALRLPRSQREVVVLIRFARLSDDDAAAILGITAAEVRQAYIDATAAIGQAGSES
jgi:hypothetical protein